MVRNIVEYYFAFPTPSLMRENKIKEACKVFKFIKNLFKKKETEEIIMDVPEVDIPEVDLHETFEAMRKNAEETDVLLQRAKEISSALDDMLKRAGVVHKFRNPATGEIYEVEPGDHETFNKMMLNKELHLVFD